MASKNFSVDNGLTVNTHDIIDKHGNISANNITGTINLTALADVDLTITSANGSILVYNEATNTYVQRAILSFDETASTFNINGGVF